MSTGQKDNIFQVFISRILNRLLAVIPLIIVALLIQGSGSILVAANDSPQNVQIDLQSAPSMQGYAFKFVSSNANLLPMEARDAITSAKGDLFTVLSQANSLIPDSAEIFIDDTLRVSVEKATIEYLGSAPIAGLVVSNVTEVDGWFFGTVGIVAPPIEGAAPDGVLFLAQKKNDNWLVVIEHTALFKSWIDQAPNELVKPEVKMILENLSPQGAGSAQLSLPWATGETWTLTGGPHSNDGTGRPWSSVDFAGGSGQVRAARDGVAYLDCANFIRINHSDGWQTGYYHISNIAVSNGQTVSRGQYLGMQSSAVGCGGSATGDHQHFSLRYNGVKQEINGRDIGGWTVQEGSAEYRGCMQRISDGNLQCTTYQGGSGQIYNDGTIGSGGGGSCPQSGGVILYWNANYNCDNTAGDAGYRQRTTTGWQNVTDGSFNDKASSLKVPSGWSIKLFADANRGGPSVCFNSEISDFGTQGNFPGSTTPINDQVSSIEVFSISNCGVGAVPAVPTNLHQTGSTSSSVTIQWDNVANETGYKIYRWNGSEMAYLASVEADVTSFTNTSLLCDEIYGYDVTAYNSYGESGHSSFLNATVSACSPPVAPGIDLDVTYISRTPLYDRRTVQQWPAENDLVTFTAHIINKGSDNCGAFTYQWLVDGIIVDSGTISGLNSGIETTKTLTWNWKSDRHSVEFRVDPGNSIIEYSKANNSILDFTDAITIGFWVERSIYELYNSKINGRGTFSWEDWAQMIIEKMNAMFENSVYPLAPNGGLTRVRLDNVTIVDDNTLFNLNYQHAPIEYTNDGQWGFSLQEYQSANADQLNHPWWVIHELMHYTFNRIDLYALDVQGGDVFVRDETNNLIAETPQLPYISWDVVHYMSRLYDLMHVVGIENIFSDYTIYSLNQDWPEGKRGQRSDWDYYFNQLPAETRIRIIDNNSLPMPNIQVSVYQALPGDGSSGPYSQNFDNTPDLNGVTDVEGIFSLGSHPFGDLNTYGTPVGIVLLKLKNLSTNAYRYTWLELTELNMAYWRGERQVYTQDIRFPDGSPTLHLSQNLLTIHALQGINPLPVSVQVETFGTVPKYWSVSQPTVSWLSTIPYPDLDDKSYPSGPLYFSVNSANLPIGTYTGQVTVSAEGAVNSPQTITVMLIIDQLQNVYIPLVAKSSQTSNTISVYSKIEDGEILNMNCSVWSTCRNAATGNVNWQDLGVGTVGAGYTAPKYIIQRIFLFFDTTSIPSGANITSVVLHVFAGQYQNGTKTFHVVPSTATIPLSTTDFGKISFVSGGAATPTSLNSWVSINFIPTALTWITKGGLTKVALINEYDVYNVVPTIANDITVGLAEDSLHKPYLTITYSMP